MAEANYLKAPQNTIFRQRLHKIFKHNQHTFDKSYKKAKRNFERDKRIHIEQLNTNNLREFWSELNNLGPRKILQWKYMMIMELSYLTIGLY